MFYPGLSPAPPGDGPAPEPHPSLGHPSLSQAGPAAPDSLARTIALATYHRSLDAEALSPFALEARAEGYAAEIGGKPDDISVLVATVRAAL